MVARNEDLPPEAVVGLEVAGGKAGEELAGRRPGALQVPERLARSGRKAKQAGDVAVERVVPGADVEQRAIQIEVDYGRRARQGATPSEVARLFRRISSSRSYASTESRVVRYGSVSIPRIQSNPAGSGLILCAGIVGSSPKAS